MVIWDTAIIRNRGQITLPDSIRRVLSWLKPSQPVSIEASDNETIIIRPYASKQRNWDLVNDALQTARTYKTTSSLTEFIIEDRDYRR